ncbi:MAG: hypothetical protein WA705_13405 [Candidatus Ozemobacteraceae bacterium]
MSNSSTPDPGLPSPPLPAPPVDRKEPSSPRLFRPLVVAICFALTAFAILIQDKYSFTTPFQSLGEWDPDVLIRLRRTEQVVGSGGALPIMGTDYYSGFPYPHRYPCPPLLDVLCTRIVWIFSALFPDSHLDISAIIGWLPPAIGAFFAGWFFLWSYRRTRRWALSCFFCIALIFDSMFASVFRYHQIDHHCLESFFLWTWIMTATSFSATAEGGLASLVLGGLLLGGLITAWAASPFPIVVFTVYGLIVCLFSTSWAKRYLEYLYGSLIIAGALTILINIKAEILFFRAAEYSMFQPFFTLVTGFFLKGFSYLKYESHVPTAGMNPPKEPSERPKMPQSHAFFGCTHLLGWVALLLCACGGIFWLREPIFDGFLYLTMTHPIFSTITELRPFVRLQNDPFTITELLRILSPSFLIVPLGIILCAKSFLKREGAIVTHLGLGTFFLTFLRVRHFRWMPFFTSLWNGIVFNLFFTAIYRALCATKSRWKGLATLLCLGMPLWAYIAVAFESRERFITQETSAFIHAMVWMQKNTPDPGGYFDGTPPKYGVLAFWDLGHALTYYSKRPAVCNNFQWGLDTWVGVAGSTNEEEAYKTCQKSLVRYFVVTPAHQGEFEEVIPYLRKTVYSQGRIQIAQSQFVKDNIVPMKERDSIQGKLFRKLGTGDTKENGLSHFRLIYLSTSSTQNRYPWLRIFEVVPGATVKGKAAPLASVTLSLPLLFPTIGNSPRTYFQKTFADAEGNFSFTVPYATDDLTGGVKTSSWYTLSSVFSGTSLVSSFTTKLSEIQEGKVLCPDLAWREN